MPNSLSLMILLKLINMFWVLGSISYVAEQWLIGGLCYLAGGLFAVSPPNMLRLSVSLFLCLTNPFQTDPLVSILIQLNTSRTCSKSPASE